MNPKGSTMALIAEKAGVSITTVSHVINRTRHVNQSTKDTVLKVIRELNYRTAKKSKANGSDGVCIGVILADAREDYYMLMMKAMETVADEYGISVVFCDSEANHEKEVKNINLLLKQNVDGILLAPADTERRPKILDTITIPIILIDRQYESHSFLAIGINNHRSAYLGTMNLFKKGCKKIGFIGYSDPVDTIRQRIQGYKSAVLEHDSTSLLEAPLPEVLHLKYNGGDSFPLITQFLTKGNFDGLICATSGICYELIEVVDSLDETSANKIKIISFDDNRWFDYLKYPVSVISQPVAEIGNAALENLLRLVEQDGNNCNVKRELFFDITIIDR
jgi:LacI family transcriptional regulator